MLLIMTLSRRLLKTSHRVITMKTSIKKFYFVHIVKVCFVFKKQLLCFISPHMHKALPTLENEKEQ